MLSPGAIPSSVTSLICQSDVNVFQAGSLLFGLKHLVTRFRSTRSLADLFPDTLEHLELRRPVQAGDLPASLKYLKINLYDNEALQNVLGFSEVQQALDPDIFPPALEYLSLESISNLSLRPGVFPVSLTELHLIGHRAELVIGSLPAYLVHLTLDDCSFPGFGVPEEQKEDFIRERKFGEPLQPGIIPFGVKSVTFGYYFVQHLLPGTIPASVTKLDVGGMACLKPTDFIPTSVTHLMLHQMVKAGVIPSSVTHLSLLPSRAQPVVAGVIPSSVTHLRLGEKLSAVLSVDIIPSSVTTLALFQHHLAADTADSIPASVTSLEISIKSRNEQSATLITLPSTVQEVLIPAHDSDNFGQAMKWLDPSIRVAHGKLQW